MVFVLLERLTQLFQDPSDVEGLEDLLRVSVGGLRGGTLSVVPRRGDVAMKLRRLSYVPGIRLSGTVDEKGRGTLRVTGRRTPHGSLRVSKDRVEGRLGGRLVRAKLDFEPDEPELESLLVASSRRLVVPGSR
jgi:hypothetical protein